MNDSNKTYNAAVFRGVGRPKTVMDAYIDALDEFPDQLADLLSLRDIVCGILEVPDSKRIVMALACSLMNLNYLDHGHCYQTDENGETGFSYSEPGETRNMIWHGLINLPD